MASQSDINRQVLNIVYQNIELNMRSAPLPPPLGSLGRPEIYAFHDLARHGGGQRDEESEADWATVKSLLEFRGFKVDDDGWTRDYGWARGADPYPFGEVKTHESEMRAICEVLGSSCGSFVRLSTLYKRRMSFCRSSVELLGRFTYFLSTLGQYRVARCYPGDYFDTREQGWGLTEEEMDTARYWYHDLGFEICDPNDEVVDYPGYNFLTEHAVPDELLIRIKRASSATSKGFFVVDPEVDPDWKQERSAREAQRMRSGQRALKRAANNY